MDTSTVTNGKTEKSFFEKISLWLGLLGTVVTIALTVWNAHTKSQIDQREEDLKTLEVQLKERATGVEELKERVDRYKWVLSMFPTLNGNNEKEKNFTLNLVRLALTKEEAEQLFTGLQSSSDTALQSLGESGINVIQNEQVTTLISQMNADKAGTRKSAVAKLVQEYRSSSQAITLALRLFDNDKMATLSPSGVINVLYFLSATDAAAWNKQQMTDAQKVAAKINAANPGPQTQAALSQFTTLLKTIQPQ